MPTHQILPTNYNQRNRRLTDGAIHGNLTGTIMVDRDASSGKRLTGKDVEMFERFADRLVETGLWDRIERPHSESYDCFDVYGLNDSDPAYSFGRAKGGHYILLDNLRRSVQIGSSLSELLSGFMNRQSSKK